MPPEHHSYDLRPYPRSRLLMADGGRLGLRKHTVHGLVEFDVTRAREILHRQKSERGEALSFTAFFLACLGKAVDRNKELHAYRNRRNQIVLFDQVDVNTLFEVQVDGRKSIRPHILRGVNKKSVHELHREIRAFQQEHAGSREAAFVKWFVWLPGFLRRAVLRAMLRDPHRLKEYYGTVLLTSIGMFGSGSGWGIPVSNHTLQITLGGMAKKPGVVDHRVAVREYLSVTITIDHDMVDGAPAARFVECLRGLVESADGLVAESPPPDRGAEAAP